MPANPSTLRLTEGPPLSAIRFEAKCPTGLGGTPPHLDLLAEAGDAVLGVESKCIEFLNPHEPAFSRSYDLFPRANPYAALIDDLRHCPAAYDRLDAAQLVKHALGLGACYPGRRVTLIYLFWEPANWSSFEPFCRHREELQTFASAVAGAAVRFEWRSYPELWAAWASGDTPAWLPGHVDALLARYGLHVDAGRV